MASSWPVRARLRAIRLADAIGCQWVVDQLLRWHQRAAARRMGV